MRGGWLLVLLPLLLAISLRIGLGLAAVPQPEPGDPALRISRTEPWQEVRLQGHLLGDPQPVGSGKACRALLQLPVGRTELNFDPCPPLRQRWRLAVEGVLRRPQPAPHPLLAGPAERLARQQTWSQLRVRSHRVLERRGAAVADLRRRMADALQHQAGSERGALLAALVVGSAATPLPQDVREAFRAAGLSHALAASGFQLSVLLGVVLPITARLPTLVRLGTGAGVLVLFVLLAGPQPAVLRAALMGGLGLVLLEGHRQGRPLPVLACCSLVLLLIQPRWLTDVGFQLSVVATGALMLSAGPLERGLRRWLPARGLGWIATAVSVPLAASIWTLPLQLLHFGVIPLYAVPANLLAAPLLTPLTLGAMALAVVAVLLPAALPLLTPPVAWLGGLLQQLAATVARLPMAQWQLGRPQPLLVLLLALAVAAVMLPGLPRRWRRWWPALLALVVSLHLAGLLGDQLLLVHQGFGDRGSDLLLARHRGRAALVASRGDGFSCQRAGQLATALGLPGYDWALLLDPVASSTPQCWQRQSGLLLASGDGSTPLLPGQRLESPGLSLEPVAIDSQVLLLRIGSQRWLLLPDRQALWSWQETHGQRDPNRRGKQAETPPISGTWLGFTPRPGERRWLEQQQPGRLWLSGSPSQAFGSRWQTTGPSGSLSWTAA